MLWGCVYIFRLKKTTKIKQNKTNKKNSAAKTFIIDLISNILNLKKLHSSQDLNIYIFCFYFIFIFFPFHIFSSFGFWCLFVFSLFAFFLPLLKFPLDLEHSFSSYYFPAYSIFYRALILYSCIFFICSILNPNTFSYRVYVSLL